jgi:deoxyribonuclease IV
VDAVTGAPPAPGINSGSPPGVSKHLNDSSRNYLQGGPTTARLFFGNLHILWEGAFPLPNILCTRYPFFLMRLGMHCSTAGGPHKAIERGLSCGGESIQLFVKNNMQWAGRPYTPTELDRYQRARRNAPIAHLFGHTGYLLNIAAPPSPNRDRTIESLIQEIQLADQLQLPFLVLHPGAHLGSGEAEGLRHAARALDEVFHATQKSSVRIALENTAGQGTCLGHVIEHLAALYDTVSATHRLGVCIDTAHLFAAGHDIRTRAGWNQAVQQVVKLIGFEQILAFHLNDSKTDLGSRVDRHAGIGQGKIGRAPFAHIINDARFPQHPGCLETPKSPDLHEDIENLQVLRSLLSPRKTIVAMKKKRAK